MNPQPPYFSQLAWHSCRLNLAPRRNVGATTPALVVLNALLKSVKTGDDPDPERPAVRRAFHVPDAYAHRLRLPAGRPFPLEIVFFGTDEAGVAARRTYNILIAEGRNVAAALLSI